LLCAGDHTSAALTGNNDMQQKVSFIVDINLLRNAFTYLNNKSAFFRGWQAVYVG